MALIKADRVRETTTTTGTSDFVLGGATAGYRSFASVCANNDVAYYTAIDQATGDWECGLGTFTTTPATLVRNVTLASSTGSKISFGSGPKDVLMSVNSGAIQEPWKSTYNTNDIPTNATTWTVYGPNSIGYTLFSSGSQYTNLTSLTFQNLTHCTNYSSGFSFRLTGFPALLSITAQRLIFANSISVFNNPSLQTTLISAITRVYRIFVSNCPMLYDLQFGPFFLHCFESFSIANCPALTTIASMPLLGIGGSVDLSGNALIQLSVDNVLSVLAGYDGTNGKFLYGSGKTVNLSGGTNAAPSATGLAAKATLVARGCTVTHN